MSLPGLCVRLEFKPADCWIGAYWELKRHDCSLDVCWGNRMRLWLCLLPMLPLHVSWLVRTARAGLYARQKAEGEG